jgi:hypothetical protein
MKTVRSYSLVLAAVVGVVSFSSGAQANLIGTSLIPLSGTGFGNVTGAGLPGLIAACGGFLCWWRRKRESKLAR